MKFHLGPWCITITSRRRSGPAARPPGVSEVEPVPHEVGVRRLREEVAAAVPVDDAELARARRVGIPLCSHGKPMDSKCVECAAWFHERSAREIGNPRRA